MALLHDPKFLSDIDSLQPDITTWLGHRNFQRILSHREAMVIAANRLGKALSDLLDLVEEESHPIIADTKWPLSVIQQYKLREQ